MSASRGTRQISILFFKIFLNLTHNSKNTKWKRILYVACRQLTPLNIFRWFAVLSCGCRSVKTSQTFLRRGRKNFDKLYQLIRSRRPNHLFCTTSVPSGHPIKIFERALHPYLGDSHDKHVPI